ncbi:MAG: 4-(cytidine 5'-diphospho)-2-C-methyl-D-erythritol kinase [Rhodospirillales bacterium]|nr:4-(cytidine 5'-diphospho)-2-C-methyl-D-erythritol kinase [Rhodospirillales bacterium]
MVDQAPPLREPAPAKLNFYLHVTGKRDDGYHLLDSLVVFAGIGDRIEAEAADEITLDYQGPFADLLPAPEQNLVMRAAKELAAIFDIRTGAKLTLNKSLPVASGIGGGSADAAAALRLLIRLWRLPPDDPRISKLALSLGADVPVCLMSRPAVMRGVGEEITLLKAFPELPIVLVNPGVEVSTPAVFKKRDGDFSDAVDWPSEMRESDAVIEHLTKTHNDLETPAGRIAPEIADVLKALDQADGARMARMSGSGATCFGVFERIEMAEAAAAQIADTHHNWWVAAARTYGA